MSRMAHSEKSFGTGGTVFVPQLGGGEASVLGGVGEGNGCAVQRREGVLAVVRREDPEATGAAVTADIGGERGDEVHVAVAREEAGMGGQARLAAELMAKNAPRQSWAAREASLAVDNQPLGANLTRWQIPRTRNDCSASRKC